MACMAVVDGLETEPDPRYGRISARFRFEDPGQGARYDSALWSVFLCAAGRQRLLGWPLVYEPLKGFDLYRDFDFFGIRPGAKYPLKRRYLRSWHGLELATIILIDRNSHFDTFLGFVRGRKAYS